MGKEWERHRVFGFTHRICFGWFIVHVHGIHPKAHVRLQGVNGWLWLVRSGFSKTRVSIRLHSSLEHGQFGHS